jgi:hypothetical protein
MTREEVPAEQKSKVFTALQKRGITPQSKDEKAKAESKKNTAGTARAVLDVLDKHIKGQLSGQEFDDALNYAASDYNKRGFDEGGKQLTGAERSILSGTMINQSERVPTLMDKAKTAFTGYKTPTKSIVADDERTLRNKMAQVLKLDPETASEGAAVKAAKNRATTTSGGNTYTPPKNDEGVISQIFHALVDPALKAGKVVGEGINSGIDLASHTGDIMAGKPLPAYKPIFLDDNEYKKMTQGDSFITGGAGKEALKTAAGAASYVPGGSTLKGALAGGAAAGAMYGFGQSEDGNEVHDTLTGGASGALLGGGIKAGGKAINALTGGGAGKIGGAEGRLLTSIAAPDPESVTRSEKLMKTALSITKSNSSRGMSKELEAFIPKATAEIKTHVANIDKQIGMQPVGEVTKFIEEKLLQSPAGQARPELVKSVLKHLTNQITAGELPGGMATGEPFGTTLTKLNQGRLFLNRGTGSWFERGRPLQSDADMISALSWDASTAIKELMAQADDSGTLQKILDLQHAAIEVSPALAKQALKGGSGSYGLTQTVIKAIKAVLSPAKVAATRQISKGGNKEALARQLMSGAMPTPEQIAPANQMPSYARP